jgi:hypothetical protein
MPVERDVLGTSPRRLYPAAEPQGVAALICQPAWHSGHGSRMK